MTQMTLMTLNNTLLKAIQNLADSYTKETAMQINGILHDLQGGTTELEKLQQKVADAQQEFDHLLDLSLEMQCVISGR